MTNTTEIATAAPKPLREGYTDDPMAYLVGVDPSWAEQYVEYSKRIQHFTNAAEIFYLTPRLVRIAVLRPESIVRLFRARHAKDSSENPGKIGSFEESNWYIDHEEWVKPMENSLYIHELTKAVKRFHGGMSPMEALQKHHADANDGEENYEIPASSPPLQEMLMLFALFMMVVAGAIGLYNGAKESHQRQNVIAPESQKAN